jgi:hypothetical protein
LGELQAHFAACFRQKFVRIAQTETLGVQKKISLSLFLFQALTPDFKAFYQLAQRIHLKLRLAIGRSCSVLALVTLDLLRILEPSEQTAVQHLKTILSLKHVQRSARP